MDTLSILIALFSLVAAIAASVASVIQAKELKLATQAETFFKLVEKFESAEFKETRKYATQVCSTNLATKTAGIDVEDLLDFFEDIAFWVRKGAIDKDMALHGFYHWIRLYYESSREYIAIRTQAEATVWENLKWLYPILIKMECLSSRGNYVQNIDDGYLKEQLQDEWDAL